MLLSFFLSLPCICVNTIFLSVEAKRYFTDPRRRSYFANVGSVLAERAWAHLKEIQPFIVVEDFKALTEVIGLFTVSLLY